jgi:hypothetical protein
MEQYLHQARGWWNGATTRDKAFVFAGAGVLLSMLGRQLCILLMVGGYLYLKRPTQESFKPAFRHWFTEVYFPKISTKLKEELEARAKRGSLLQSMKDRVRAWVTDNTKELQAQVWYELVMKHCTTRYLDLGVVILATVECTPDSAMQFVGVHETWVPLSGDLPQEPLLELMEKNK